MKNDVEILDKETVYQGFFRIDRYRLRHRRFDGGWTAPMTREIFERGHAVAALLYDPLTDRVGLIEQFRPGTLSEDWHPWLIEIVAGMVKPGETPEEVLCREALEEAGAEITSFLPMFRYLVSPGGSSESIWLYLARADASQLGGFHGLEEEGEDIRVFSVPFTEALEWINSGEINNSMTILALQWLALNKNRVLQNWSASESQSS